MVIYKFQIHTISNTKIEICFIFNFCPNFSGDDDEEEEEGGDEGEEGEEKMPTCGDYIMHFLTLFWKVIFAVIPPAGKQNENIFFLIKSCQILEI